MRHILVAVDGSEASARAVEWVGRFAATKLVGTIDQFQYGPRPAGLPSAGLHVIGSDPHHPALAVHTPRTPPVIARKKTVWRRLGTDAEPMVLLRENATPRGVADAVTALKTPDALLLGPPYRLSSRLEGLTRREHEVLTELALGKVNKEIARNLHVTRETARRYVGRVLKKLRVANRTQAARLALLGDPRGPPHLAGNEAG